MFQISKACIVSLFFTANCGFYSHLKLYPFDRPGFRLVMVNSPSLKEVFVSLAGEGCELSTVGRICTLSRRISFCIPWGTEKVNHRHLNSHSLLLFGTSFLSVRNANKGTFCKVALIPVWLTLFLKNNHRGRCPVLYPNVACSANMDSPKSVKNLENLMSLHIQLS